MRVVVLACLLVGWAGCTSPDAPAAWGIGLEPPDIKAYTFLEGDTRVGQAVREAQMTGAVVVKACDGRVPTIEDLAQSHQLFAIMTRYLHACADAAVERRGYPYESPPSESAVEQYYANLRADWVDVGRGAEDAVGALTRYEVVDTQVAARLQLRLLDAMAFADTADALMTSYREHGNWLDASSAFLSLADAIGSATGVAAWVGEYHWTGDACAVKPSWAKDLRNAMEEAQAAAETRPAPMSLSTPEGRLLLVTIPAAEEVLARNWWQAAIMLHSSLRLQQAFFEALDERPWPTYEEAAYLADMAREERTLWSEHQIARIAGGWEEAGWTSSDGGAEALSLHALPSSLNNPCQD